VVPLRRWGRGPSGGRGRVGFAGYVSTPAGGAGETGYRHGWPRSWWFKGAAVALVLGFLLVHAYFVADAGGARFGGDTPRYVDGAEDLVAGDGLTGRQQLYAGYIVVVAAAQEIGLGLDGVVAFQVLLAAAAAVALFDLGRTLGGPWAGLAAAGVFAVNPDFARWSVFILPDSLYMSTLVLAVWGVHRATGRGWRAYAGASVLVLVAAPIRPNGWMLVPIATCYWILRGVPGRRRWALLAGVGVAFAAVLSTVPARSDTTTTLDPEIQLRRGVVIWGVDRSNLSMPSAPPSSRSGWPGVLDYAAREPFATARVGLARVGVELRHTRSFYSTAHNALALLYLIPIYAMAALGLLVAWRHPLIRLLAVVVAAHLFVISLVAADYDGRFLLHFLALIGVIAVPGGVWVAGHVIRSMPTRRAAPPEGAGA
jgi:hypothetical protein